VCGRRSCIDGFCAIVPMPQGPSPSQIYGNCKTTQCDGEGNEAPPLEDPTDTYDDGNKCTQDVCIGGVPTLENVAKGTACFGGICDGKGACVDCIDDAVCNSPQFCLEGLCVPPTCVENGMKDGPETDVDCGGGCLPCDDGKACGNGAHCKSGLCGSMICTAPTCFDTIKNGTETAPDCGGPDCPPCPTNTGCALPSDCESGVCKSGVCQQPSCQDGVKNGSEEGVDCGDTSVGAGGAGGAGGASSGGGIPMGCGPC
jgi:hypothetical protein